MIGGDWKVYKTYFETRNTWHEYNDGTFEILYSLLNFLVKKVTGSSIAFFFLIAYIGISLKYNVIKKIALYPALSLFLFFSSHLSDIFMGRQNLAIALLFVSIYFIHTKQKLPFVFLTIIAIGIHVTTLLWLFAYYVYHKKISNVAILFVLLASLAIGIGTGSLYATLFNILLPSLNENFRIISKMAIYFNDYSHKTSLFYILTSLVKRFSFILLFFIFRKKICDTNEYASGLLNLYFLGNIFYLIFIVSFTEFQRMDGPFMYLDMFLFPTFLKIINKRYIKYLFFFLLLAFGLLNITSFFLKFPGAYEPYHSILG
jgi:hypothetical protein